MRVAHFSDLHLLSIKGTKLLDYANKRWIGGLNLLTSRGRHHHTAVFEALVRDVNELGIEHAICTGDVTNLALEQEFQFARECFDELDLGTNNVTVLPGNHDTYVAKGAEYFTGYFSDYFEPDPGFTWDDGDAWPIVRIRNGVAIIGVSTSLTTPWFTAYGVVGQPQLERLRAILTDPRLANCYRIVAIHHPPAGAYARSRIRGLKDRAALHAILAETGAELIIHGHEHRDISEELPGPEGQPIPVRGIQSGTYEAGKHDRRARYRIFDFGDGGAVRHAQPVVTLRVWDLESGRFVADEGIVRESAGVPATESA
jgi:3',5'-cyclic AMP phosphodiesterase CpdA